MNKISQDQMSFDQFWHLDKKETTASSVTMENIGLHYACVCDERFQLHRCLLLKT